MLRYLTFKCFVHAVAASRMRTRPESVGLSDGLVCGTN